jgi:hypothetical protein
MMMQAPRPQPGLCKGFQRPARTGVPYLRNTNARGYFSPVTANMETACFGFAGHRQLPRQGRSS